MGAEVTVVDTESKLEFLHSLGADYVIDYTQKDFTRNGLSYDLIIDVIASRSLSQYKHSLNSGGAFLMIGGTMPVLFQSILLSRLVSTKDKRLGLMAYAPNKGLDRLAEMCTSGKIRPVIDKVFPLEKTIDAFRHYLGGQFKGKIVITM